MIKEKIHKNSNSLALLHFSIRNLAKIVNLVLNCKICKRKERKILKVSRYILNIKREFAKKLTKMPKIIIPKSKI